MTSFIDEFLLKQINANAVVRGEVIQSLWSGYGEIVRYQLLDADRHSVVVKHIAPPAEVNHPRGWHSEHSHSRKLRSYRVESNWYRQWSSSCDASCSVPTCLGIKEQGQHSIIVMEDLDQSGYSLRKSNLGDVDMKACLRWLANFHATFMNEPPEGLWPIGSYWHLATRPEEWQAMEQGALKQAASQLDQRLNQARYQTFVHGDAKAANFCFADNGRGVAAVDFQYVGGGCGMKDVAYFMGSCMDETSCEKNEHWCLDYYFKELAAALATNKKSVDFQALEREWRALFPVAWTDFYRFLQGWMPTHYKINSYTRKLAGQVLADESPG